MKSAQYRPASDEANTIRTVSPELLIGCIRRMVRPAGEALILQLLIAGKLAR
jgi:hypothetical protein